MTEVRVVKKRKDFIKVAKQGEKVVQPTLILQAAFNLSVAGDTCQIGYTVTKNRQSPCPQPDQTAFARRSSQHFLSPSACRSSVRHHRPLQHRLLPLR